MYLENETMEFHEVSLLFFPLIILKLQKIYISLINKLILCFDEENCVFLSSLHFLVNHPPFSMI